MDKIMVVASTDQIFLAYIQKTFASSFLVKGVQNFHDIIPYLNIDNCPIIIDSSNIEINDELFKKKKKLSCKILVIGNSWPKEKQIKLLILGVAGYFEKESDPELLQKAIDHILLGEIWIERKLITEVIERLVSLNVINKHLKFNNESLKNLTQRESQIATMVCSAESNQSIATNLEITQRTVKAHMNSIFRKLHVSDRLHLAVMLKNQQNII